MNDGPVAGYKESWRTDIHEPKFFNKLLEPVLDHNRVDDEDLDWVLDQGLDHIQKTADNLRKPARRSHPLRSQRVTD